MGGDNETTVMDREAASAEALKPDALVASPHETSATAVAVTARALVEARYVMALQRPRSWDDVREKVLRACQRTRFAEAALYSKPVGSGKIWGLSIRFAEEAVRSMGNLDVSTPVVYDDPYKLIVRVTVTDLESNVIYSHDITVVRTVERRSLRDGQAALSVRQNSAGQTVYTVKATDDDIANKTNALISKALRNNVLRLLPADIQEEARNEISKTLHAETARDPEAARKRVLDGFAGLNVKPSAVAELLGHDVDQCSPAEIEELRATYQAIKDGETTWQAVITEHRDSSGKKAAPKKTASTAKDAVAKAAEAAESDAKEREPGEDG